jgi:chemotaxis signal transduction protein
MPEVMASGVTAAEIGAFAYGARPKFLVVETESSRELLPLSDVVELSEPLPIVPLPSGSTMFAHAIVHRDIALPMIDLDALLGHAAENAYKPGAYAIVEIDDRRCALAIKRVVGLSAEAGGKRVIDVRLLLADLPLAVQAPEATSRYRATAAATASRYLLIELAGQTCGFELAAVVHLHSERQVVRAPRTADSLAIGVTAIGGRVLPVLDLAARLGLSTKVPMPNFVELHYPEGGTFVIAVERISGIATIAQEALSHPPDGRPINAVTQLGAKSIWIVTPALIAKRDARGSND